MAGCVVETDGHVRVRVLRLSCSVLMYTHHTPVQGYHAQAQRPRLRQVSITDSFTVCCFLSSAVITLCLSVWSCFCVSVCLWLCLSVRLRLSVSLSVTVCLSLCLILCFCLSMTVSVCPSLSVCLSVWFCFCVSVCLWLSVCLSLSVCVRLSVSLWLCLCLSVSVCLSVTLSLSVSDSVCMSLQVYCISHSIVHPVLSCQSQSKAMICHDVLLLHPHHVAVIQG